VFDQGNRIRPIQIDLFPLTLEALGCFYQGEEKGWQMACLTSIFTPTCVRIIQSNKSSGVNHKKTGLNEPCLKNNRKMILSFYFPETVFFKKNTDHPL